MVDLQPLAAGLLGTGFVYQLRRIRRDPHNPVLRCMALTLGLLIIAITMGLSWPYRAFDQFGGIPNAARFVQHTAAMTAFCVTQIMLRYVVHPAQVARSGIRPRVAVLFTAVTTMLILFAMAPLDVEAPEGFVDRYGGQPSVAAYLMLYLGYLSVCLVDAIRTTHQYAARCTDRPWLRSSLRMTVTAGMVGLLYVAVKGGFTLAAWHKVDLPLAEDDVSSILIAAGAVCTGIGVLLPVIGRRVDALRQWRREWRLHRDMYPLWSAIYQAVPYVVLGPPAAPANDTSGVPAWVSARCRRARQLREDVADVGWALYRRTIEIQDGLLDLRFYRQLLAADIARRLALSAGLTGEELRSVVEAADIAAAIQAKRAGLPAAEGGEAAPLTAGGEDLNDWLARVARAYAASPEVAMTLAQLPGGSFPPREDNMITPADTQPSPAQVNEVVPVSGGARPRSMVDRAARLLTDVLSPAVLIVLVVIPMAWHSATTPTQALLCGVLAAVTGSLIPITYIIWGVRRGRWTDHHVGVRAQRWAPLTVALASGTVGAVLLALSGAREMMAMAAAGISALVTAIIITFGLRWKVSIHSVVAAGSVGVLTLTFGPWLLFTWPVAVAIGWSRVRLRDHTTGQVVVGLVIGAVAASTVFPLLR